MEFEIETLNLNLPGYLQAKETEYKIHSDFLIKVSRRIHAELVILVQFIWDLSSKALEEYFNKRADPNES